MCGLRGSALYDVDGRKEADEQVSKYVGCTEFSAAGPVELHNAMQRVLQEVLNDFTGLELSDDGAHASDAILPVLSKLSALAAPSAQGHWTNVIDLMAALASAARLKLEYTNSGATAAERVRNDNQLTKIYSIIGMGQVIKDAQIKVGTYQVKGVDEFLQYAEAMRASDAELHTANAKQQVEVFMEAPYFAGAPDGMSFRRAALGGGEHLWSTKLRDAAKFQVVKKYWDDGPGKHLFPTDFGKRVDEAKVMLDGVDVQCDKLGSTQYQAFFEEARDTWRRASATLLEGQVIALMSNVSDKVKLRTAIAAKVALLNKHDKNTGASKDNVHSAIQAAMALAKKMKPLV